MLVFFLNPTIYCFPIHFIHFHRELSILDKVFLAAILELTGYKNGVTCYLPNPKQIVHNNRLINDTRMLALSNTHCCHHHQLNTMCLGVHFTFRKSVHFGIQVYFIVCGYGVFPHCEFHFAHIVGTTCFAFQQ